MLSLRLLFVSIVLFGGTSNAQVRALKDTATINAALRASKDLVYNNPDQAWVELNNIRIAASRIKHKEAEALAYHYLGRVFIDKGLYDSCITYQLKAIDLANGTVKEANIHAAAYNLNGIALEKLGYYQKAASNYLRALKQFEETNDKLGLCNVYNNLGLLYNGQNNHARADYYYQKAFEIATELGDEFMLVTTRNNMGLSLLQQKNYKEALKHFEATLAFDLRDGDSEYIGGSYNNVGSCFLKDGKFAEAIENFRLAVSYKKEAKDKFGLTISLLNLAQAQIKLNRFSDAKLSLEEADVIIKETKVAQHRSEILSIWADYYEGIGDFKSSLDYLRKHFSLVDSSNLHLQRKEIDRLQTEFSVDKKDREILEQSRLLAEKDKRFRNLLTALITIVLLTAFLTIVIFRNRNLNRTLNYQQQQLSDQNDLLNKANDNLQKAKEVAERSSRAKSVFLSNVSHEIRTPMNVIMGLTQFLEEEKLSERGKKNIQLIQQSSSHLLHIINDILDLSKIEAGRITFEEKHFNLPELLDQLKLSTETLKGEKDITIDFNLESNLPVNYHGDRTRLQQILTNILGNAVKFTDVGTIKLDVQLVNHQRDLYTLRFTVSDTGIGIPPSRVNTIFESFTQAEDDHSRTYGGTGLGLTITKKLIELQGGNIQVQSIPGEGSIFTVELDFFAESPSILPTKVPLTEKQQIDFSKTRILLVEDNQLNISLATQLFKRWKAIYAVAENGYQALDQLKRSNFDLVLLDLHMPGMNGFDTFKEIRKGEIEVPVVALTADAFDDTREKAFAMGFDDLMIKPYRAEDLAKLISKYAS